MIPQKERKKDSEICRNKKIFLPDKCCAAYGWIDLEFGKWNEIRYPVHRRSHLKIYI